MPSKEDPASKLRLILRVTVPKKLTPSLACLTLSDDEATIFKWLLQNIGEPKLSNCLDPEFQMLEWTMPLEGTQLHFDIFYNRGRITFTRAYFSDGTRSVTLDLKKSKFWSVQLHETNQPSRIINEKQPQLVEKGAKQCTLENSFQ